ncbi:MAG: RecX family transcriptional regulator [Candidatus Cloacimonadales bacterium]
MKIQLKNKFNSKYLYEVYLDERIWGVLPLKLLKPFSQKSEIENDEFKELRAILYSYSRDKLLNYLTQQEHSEQESRNYLKKHKFHSSIIDEIIELCLDRKYISDARLAELYVRSLIELNKSRIEISFKLKGKGVSSALVEYEIERQYGKETNEEVIQENIDKAVKIYTGRQVKDVYSKCCSYLMRKGFFYSDFSEQLKHKINYNDDDFD